MIFCKKFILKLNYRLHKRPSSRTLFGANIEVQIQREKAEDKEIRKGSTMRGSKTEGDTRWDWTKRGDTKGKKHDRKAEREA